jgi:type II secretory pathway pseudopilin PulG
MTIPRWLCASVLLLASLAAGMAPRIARADGPASADRLKSAAEEYDRGRRAFLADDYEGAAVHFENAYRDAPRAETLRLAIRARRRAKQLARAAMLAAVAQQQYPDDASTAQLAKETLAEAGPQLHEYVIDCDADCAVAADGRVVSQSDARKHRIFLEPGSHELGVSFKTGDVSKHVDAAKGGKEALAFEAPPPAQPPAVAPVAPVAPPHVTAPPASHKPFGPLVFIVAAGVTVGVGAATVVSGIDTKNNPGTDAVRAACAGKDASCPEYQDGKSKETRTNVLLGVTLGAAVITGVIGVFFTQWSSSPVTVGAGPLPGGGGSLGAAGRF